jgi:hypothetical protein
MPRIIRLFWMLFLLSVPLSLPALDFEVTAQTTDCSGDIGFYSPPSIPGIPIRCSQRTAPTPTPAKSCSRCY